MLPGRRTFSDTDVLNVVKESLAVFTRLEAETTIPEDLREQVFTIVHNMVGNRTLAEGLLPGMLGGSKGFQ